MTPLPRRECPACGRSVPLRKGGYLREHVQAAGGKRCPAEGMKFSRAAKLVAAGKLK